MTTCVTCKWGETENPGRRGDYALYCACPEAALPVLRVDYVTGGNVYAETGDTGESRPLCRDTNTTGECPWWEQGLALKSPPPPPSGWRPLHGDNPARDARPGVIRDDALPPRRSWWQRLFGRQ